MIINKNNETSTNCTKTSVSHTFANVEHLRIEDDKIYNYYPLHNPPYYNDGIFKKTLVMDKYTFIECYNKWINKEETRTNPCTSCPQQVDCWGLAFGDTENKQYKEGGCSDYLKWKDECKSMLADDKIIKVSDNTEDNSILALYKANYDKDAETYTKEEVIKIINDIKSEIDKYCDYCYSEDEYPSKSHIDIIIRDAIDKMKG